MRDKSIDIAKGIGIFLVVVGHGFSGKTNIEILIYGFHMAFFFIISGMLYGQKNIDYQFDFYKKFRTLIIPYIFFELMWCVCLAIMNVNNPAWEWKEIILKMITFRGNIATWFLPCLFLVEWLFSVIVHLGRMQYLVVMACFVMGIIIPEQLNNLMLLFLRPLVAIGFFGIGYYGYRIFKKNCPKCIYCGMAILYIIITLQNGLILFYVREFNNPVMFVFSSIIGTYLMLNVSTSISKMKRTNFLYVKFNYWGENSLTIMCVHMFLIEFIRLVDYKFLGNIFLQMNELEGIVMAIIVMSSCEIIVPVLNKYFYFLLGKKRRATVE